MARQLPAFFSILPAPVRDNPDLPATAKLLYAEISALSAADGHCWATNAYLAERLCCGERTISRYISLLQRLGVIGVDTSTDGTGGCAIRRIFVGAFVQDGVDKNVYPLDKNGEGGRQKWRGGVDKNGEAIKENNININNYPPNPPEGESCILFDEFWAAYPKRKSKGAALKAWKKLAPDRALLDAMKAALAWQSASAAWTRENGRFVPYPATWLNSRGWEDEPDSAAKAPEGEGVSFGWR